MSEQVTAVETQDIDAPANDAGCDAKVWVGPHISELSIAGHTAGTFIPGPAEIPTLCS